MNGSRAPVCYPWWQKDRLLDGIDLKADVHVAQKIELDSSQLFFEGIEVELDRQLVPWLIHPTFVGEHEVLVCRIYPTHTATGVERDCNE